MESCTQSQSLLGVTHGGSEDSGENRSDCRLGCLVWWGVSVRVTDSPDLNVSSF